MRWSHLALLGTGVALGAALFRKQPLISIVHDHFQALGSDISMLPIAEKMLLESFPLIQPYMGPERAKYVAEHLDVLGRTMWIWAKKWYKYSYEGSLSK